MSTPGVRGYLNRSEVNGDVRSRAECALVATNINNDTGMHVDSNEFKIKQKCNRVVLYLQREFHWIHFPDQCALNLDR